MFKVNDKEVGLIQLMEHLIAFNSIEISPLCWKCFGPNAKTADITSVNAKDNAISFIYDANTKEIYEVQAWDCSLEKSRVYRWVDPAYKDAYIAEYTQRNIDPNVAFDDVCFIDLEVPSDMFEKSKAILEGLPYDHKVVVELDLSDEEMDYLTQTAQNQGITVDEVVTNILEEAVEAEKKISFRNEVLDIDRKYFAFLENQLYKVCDQVEYGWTIEQLANEVFGKSFESVVAELNQKFDDLFSTFEDRCKDDLFSAYRFELEQAILAAWAVTAHLDLLKKHALAKLNISGRITPEWVDYTSNYLLGMMSMREALFADIIEYSA